jgi:hypothetical protein
MDENLRSGDIGALPARSRVRAEVQRRPAYSLAIATVVLNLYA